MSRHPKPKAYRRRYDTTLIPHKTIGAWCIVRGASLPAAFAGEGEHAMRYEATQLRDNRYAIRPASALGTCGWINGEAWAVVYITARSAAHAMLKFHSYQNREPVAEKK